MFLYRVALLNLIRHKFKLLSIKPQHGLIPFILNLFIIIMEHSTTYVKEDPWILIFLYIFLQFDN